MVLELLREAGPSKVRGVVVRAAIPAEGKADRGGIVTLTVRLEDQELRGSKWRVVLEVAPYAGDAVTKGEVAMGVPSEGEFQTDEGDWGGRISYLGCSGDEEKVRSALEDQWVPQGWVWAQSEEPAGGSTHGVHGDKDLLEVSAVHLAVE